MPSPIAHVAAGYVVCRIARAKMPVLERAFPVFFLVVGAAVLSILPDLDCALGILAGDFAGFHNNITHSFAAGIVAALLVAAGMAAAKGQRAAMAWFVLGFFCYGLHVVMDYFTAGRGVMAFWPLLTNRFESPVCLFRGVKWAAGLWSIEHLWTLLNELLFVSVIALSAVLIRRRHRAEQDI